MYDKSRKQSESLLALGIFAPSNSKYGSVPFVYYESQCHFLSRSETDNGPFFTKTIFSRFVFMKIAINQQAQASIATHFPRRETSCVMNICLYECNGASNEPGREIRSLKSATCEFTRQKYLDITESRRKEE